MSVLLRFCLIFPALAAALPCPAAEAPKAPDREQKFYRIVSLPMPPGAVLEAGALQVLGPQKLAVSTRRGEIYLGENVLSEPPAAVKWTLFAEGLHEVLGLASRDGWLYATQRGEVTRLKDENGDGRADVLETFNSSWGINGDYHEYAFSSKFDAAGNMYVALCLTGSFTSENPFRGWALRITPEGEAVPLCAGLRSPGGIGFNAAGDLFYTDNQGPWNGACKLQQLLPDAFCGNPVGLRWFDDPATKEIVAKAGLHKPEEPVSGGRIQAEAKKIPQLLLPSVYFPYNKMGQSASGFACDLSGGKFGPFAEQLFVGDQTHSTVMRVFLEKVNGHYQGACFPFMQGFASGNLGLEFAEDGSLFVYGTDRGWSARGGKLFALQRAIWNGKTPFEVLSMKSRPDGFDLQFTEPLDRAAAEKPGSYTLETFTYIYQSTYGSPEVDRTTATVKTVTVSPDGLSAHLVIEGLIEGHVHELHLPGVLSAGGQPLLHDVAFYTLNAIAP